MLKVRTYVEDLMQLLSSGTSKTALSKSKMDHDLGAINKGLSGLNHQGSSKVGGNQYRLSNKP